MLSVPNTSILVCLRDSPQVLTPPPHTPTSQVNSFYCLGSTELLQHLHPLGRSGRQMLGWWIHHWLPGPTEAQNIADASNTLREKDATIGAFYAFVLQLLYLLTNQTPGESPCSLPDLSLSSLFLCLRCSTTPHPKTNSAPPSPLSPSITSLPWIPQP